MVSGKNDIVFFGTSDICFPFLRSLSEFYNIKLIITQPDSYGGRRKKLIESPVKKFAISSNIRFIQPEKLNREVMEIIRKLNPRIGIVVSYGKFIPERIFSIPQFGTVNVHFSLLPLYRGSAPVQRALENGEHSTGITVFEIDKRMDTGPIWWQKEIRILPEERSDQLLKRLSEQGGELLPGVIDKIISGKFTKIPQNDEHATYANIIRKEEGRIVWRLSAFKIFNRFRAFQPWPGIFFYSKGKKFTVKDASPVELKHNRISGWVLETDKDKMVVGCGKDSALRITLFQPEGKKEMTPYTYLLGNSISQILD